MSFPDETSESESSVSPYRHWAYIGKMPPHARKLTAKSAPSKATPTATPTPTATTPPAPAVAATAAAPSLASALAPAFQAKVVPPVKSKVKHSFPAPSMVEVTKVREMVSHLRAHLIERQIALHDGLEAEKAFTDKLDEFMASLPE
ncbi:hypothetical protein H4582DRAFT_2062855 [Lactarius indigo]|nr:hypothetical protein H4582DRAFT_2062855 [Lactarius indigo]